MIELEFDRALDAATGKFGDDAELLATRIATALLSVLPVDGASISIGSEGFRLPLGASDEQSGTAERVQFTAGEGPCLTALETGAVISASAERVRDRWPALADLWHTRTPFRSAMSHPLMRRGGVHAALNLFFVDDTGNEQVDVADVTAVAELAGEYLADAFGPELVDASSPTARQRQQLWIMLGIAMSRWGSNAPDALARLRALAYSRETTLDELAQLAVADPAALDD